MLSQTWGSLLLTYTRCDTQLTTRRIAPYAFEKSKGLRSPGLHEFDLAEKRPRHFVSSAHHDSLFSQHLHIFSIIYVSSFLDFFRFWIIRTKRKRRDSRVPEKGNSLESHPFPGWTDYRHKYFCVFSESLFSESLYIFMG